MSGISTPVHRARWPWVILTLALLLAVFVVILGDEVDDADEPTLDEVRATAAGFDTYWMTQADYLGYVHVAVAPERITDGSTPVTCDGEPLRPDDEDLDQNAFVDAWCDEGPLVAFDLDYLSGPSLQMEMVLAHEWGHVVQGQLPEGDDLGATGTALQSELQADCFAGAWAGDTLTETARATAEARTAESGDEDGVGLDDPDAHGTSEHRVRAFRHGWDGGPVACIAPAILEVLP